MLSVASSAKYATASRHPTTPQLALSQGALFASIWQPTTCHFSLWALRCCFCSQKALLLITKMKQWLPKTSDHKAVLSLHSITLKKRASLPCSTEINENMTICGSNPRTASFVLEVLWFLKNQTPNSKDAEAGPYCFHQINPENLLKNNKDINKHQTFTYCSPRTMARALKRRAMVSGFSFPADLVQTFLFSPVKNPT